MSQRPTIEVSSAMPAAMQLAADSLADAVDKFIANVRLDAGGQVARLAAAYDAYVTALEDPTETEERI